MPPQTSGHTKDSELLRRQLHIPKRILVVIDAIPHILRV